MQKYKESLYKKGDNISSKKIKAFEEKQKALIFKKIKKSHSEKQIEKDIKPLKSRTIQGNSFAEKVAH